MDRETNKREKECGENFLVGSGCRADMVFVVVHFPPTTDKAVARFIFHLNFSALYFIIPKSLGI